MIAQKVDQLADCTMAAVSFTNDICAESYRLDGILRAGSQAAKLHTRQVIQIVADICNFLQ